MFGSTTNNQGANAYAQVGMETGVAAADPHKLIVMLFDGAIISVAAAKQYMQSGDTEQKGLAISKAIMIIDNGLRASLNKDAGGGIAENLAKLYSYMANKLLVSNLKNQPEVLDEVHDLLTELKSAWVTIGKTSVPPQAQNEAPVASPQAPEVYGTAQSSYSPKSLVNV